MFISAGLRQRRKREEAVRGGVFRYAPAESLRHCYRYLDEFLAPVKSYFVLPFSLITTQLSTLLPTMTKLIPSAALLLAVTVAATATPATLGAQVASIFNRGCGPVATWPRLGLTSGTPKIGTKIRITGSLLSPARTTVTAIGASNTKWASIPLPLMIDPRVGPPCQLLVSPDVLLFGKSTNQGQLSWTFQIPNDKRLIGLKVYLQMVNGDGKGNEHWTEGLAITFG